MILKLKPTDIPSYINAAPPEVQEKLWAMHACILKAAPGAREGLKWGMPAYSYQKILVTFAVFKKHIGFYLMASAIQALAKNITQYKTAQGSIHFPWMNHCHWDWFVKWCCFVLKKVKMA
jgi:uncharacterized protein YdhG (YjbR/CyaY superfamily)